MFDCNKVIEYIKYAIMLFKEKKGVGRGSQLKVSNGLQHPNTWYSIKQHDIELK